jgi:hypothetical protein
MQHLRRIADLGEEVRDAAARGEPAFDCGWVHFETDEQMFGPPKTGRWPLL